MQNILQYFTKGTAGTRTLEWRGAEVETFFVDKSGAPISARVLRLILATEPPKNLQGKLVLKPELGQNIVEVAFAPQRSAEELLTVVHNSLQWLYGIAATHGAYPLHVPIFSQPTSLLLEPEGDDADTDRDRLWLELDGRDALEWLCHIASVQFTVSVSQEHAIPVINALWDTASHDADYPNDTYWRRYMQTSRANYSPQRYGGPTYFANLEDYARQLAKHAVVMHNNQVSRLHVSTLGNSPNAITLFVRSVWWHFRLRVYPAPVNGGATLALEIRPLARREDAKITKDLQLIETFITNVVRTL